jgi:chaperone modulatory protein CbpM
MTEVAQLTQVQLIAEGDWLAVTEVCRLCRIDAAVVYELTELGALAPRGGRRDEWQLPASALPRLRIVGRLMRDLGVNASGAVLAVELLEAQHELERRIRRLERLAAGPL